MAHGLTSASSGSDRVVAGVTDWRLLGRLARYLRPYRGLVAAQLGLMAVASAVQVAQPLVVAHALDTAIPAGDVAGLVLAALLFSGLLAVEFATRYGSTFTMMITGQGVVRDLRKQVFARMARLDQSTFDRTPVGRLMVRATSDVESLEEMFSSGVVTIVGDLLKLGMLLVAMLALDARLALVTVALTPVFLVTSLWFRLRIRNAYRAVRAGLSRLNAYLQEVVIGLRVVRLFGQEAAEEERFRRRSRDLLSQDLRAVRYDSSYSALVELVATLAVAALVWLGGGASLQGAVTLGTLYAFLRYAQDFFQPLQDLSQKYAVLQSAMASSERVLALLDEEDLIRSPDPATRPPVPASAGTVEFQGVTFGYVPGELVLRDVSFSVGPGRTLALVGATGSGKTTITRLLNRLHDLPRGRPAGAAAAGTPGGRILLDGVDVRDLPLDVLRRRVGVVLQEPFLFSGSVIDSLFVEGPDREERAWAALEAVGAAPVVRRMGGLSATLRERGGNLSQGERQLLTFARALLHDPEVLVLDEATASVDTLTEKRIQEALGRLTASRTTIVVAHRLSTVRRADEILVLHRGTVRERGRHRDLLARDGLYARLYRLQLGEAR